MAGGNSSETPNTLAGRIVDTAGKPRAGDTVEIRPAEWISDDLPADGPDRAWRMVTDPQGGYSFVGVPSGSYVVESKGRGVGYLSDVVSVGRGSPLASLGTDTVHGLLEVAGRVVVDSSEIDASAKVHVCGTDHVAPLDKSGRFRLMDLPPGGIRLLAVLGASNTAGRAKDEFRLLPEGLLAPRLLAPSKFAGENYSQWPHVRTARIRFSPKGYLLESDQPLVPIRVHLDGSILPGPWEATGAGIRFSDSSGEKFPYQIESWDPVARKAEVWVRLPLANKGSDFHFLRLHWGRGDAPDWSDGTRVFDTAQGWVGVWHLSGPDLWKDATANKLRLSASSVFRASGVVSGGVVLAPNSRLWAEGAALQGWQDASVSLWARVDSARAGANLARLGDPLDPDTTDWRLGVVESSPRLAGFFQTSGQIRSASRPLESSFGHGIWTSLAGAFSRGSPRARLVVDDSASVLFWKDSFVVHARPNALVVGGGFSGLVDEIRLRRAGVHPEVLRLQWGADRDGSPVLEWLP